MAPTKAQLAKLKAAEAAALKRAEAANTLPDERGKKTAAAAAVTAAQSVGIPTGTVNTSLNLTKPVNQMTPEELKAYQKARVAAQRSGRELTQSGKDPENPKPSEDPGPGMYWANYGGVWRKYKYVTTTTSTPFKPSNNDNTGDNNNVGDGNNADGSNTVTTKKITDPAGPSTNISVLKSLLSSLGYSKTLVDSSTQYFMSLINEGLDYDNIVSLYTDAKDYTLKSGQKIISPFYEQYGYLNEGLTQTKTASELFNFVEGARNLVKSYNVSSKFADPESLKKYVQNNVTVEKLDERMMSAKLRTISADPQYVNTLRKLNYINTSEDLTDFFLDPKIGEAQLETNRKTAVFATEALRRSNLNTGITFDGKSLSSSAANLIAQGRSEAQIADIASQGYETIGQILQPSVGLSNIFEGQQAATAQTIQQELEAEQFMGTESKRRKKLTELGTRVFQGQAGRQTRNVSTYGQV